jgi:hypothetical protein
MHCIEHHAHNCTPQLRAEFAEMLTCFRQTHHIEGGFLSGLF